MSLRSQQRTGGAGDSGTGEIGRTFLVPAVVGALAVLTMIVFAIAYGLPIRDPDAKYVGSPIALISLIVAAFMLLDVIPRGWSHARAEGVGLPRAWAQVLRLRWLGKRGAIVCLCILSFYATYLSYRNLKSYIPFVTDANYDVDLLNFERWLFFGHDPATLLHNILGTDFAAHALALVYLIFLTFVPVSLGVALIWSNRLQTGIWYVTALSFNWILGTVSYYLLPAMGPIYERPGLFAGLPHTGVTDLQDKLLQHRGEVLRNPAESDAVQSIAAFASLHTSVVFTAALIAHLVKGPKVLRIGLWCYLALTAVSTIYFGWHYIVDDIAGLGIGFVAVYASARLTGYEWDIVPARLRALAQSGARAT